MTPPTLVNIRPLQGGVCPEILRAAPIVVPKPVIPPAAGVVVNVQPRLIHNPAATAALVHKQRSVATLPVVPGAPGVLAPVQDAVLIPKPRLVDAAVSRIGSVNRIVLGARGELVMTRVSAVQVIPNPAALAVQRLVQARVNGELAMKGIPQIPMKTMIQGRAMFLWTLTASDITTI